jgi:hypothetical protein
MSVKRLNRIDCLAVFIGEIERITALVYRPFIAQKWFEYISFTPENKHLSLMYLAVRRPASSHGRYAQSNFISTEINIRF